MRSVDCQVQFVGGPHHGAVVTLPSAPQKCWMVPSQATWIKQVSSCPSKASSGLQAAYLLTESDLAELPAGAARICKYRFLAYYAPATPAKTRLMGARPLGASIAGIAATIANSARNAMRSALRGRRPVGASAASR